MPYKVAPLYTPFNIVDTLCTIDAAVHKALLESRRIRNDVVIFWQDPNTARDVKGFVLNYRFYWAIPCNGCRGFTAQDDFFTCTECNGFGKVADNL